ncbi:hypothetical protein [Nonlabens ulvanivorans]|uniref:hypothetical protein n=1 Tax=Nonlabens ulvanivorans TaxID=906888 RepID=UPI002942AE9F|nr:hypothetical protein [Nonlabens ulvanivorans]WOI22474.1 hypothetical protein R1T42_12450 [Nonlabens ulvanivorans]
MNRIFFLIFLFLFCITNTFAQVGINTDTPDTSSLLEIESSDKGILIPRMSTSDRDLIALPEVSLLIFNLTTNTYQYNAGTKISPEWNNISYNPSVKYTNTDTTTNINTAVATDAPIFGTLNWNDDTILYTVSGNILTINSDGRYRITVNIYYEAPDVAGNNSERRLSVLAQLEVGGVQTGTIAATGYLRHDDNHEQASLNFTETLDIANGQTVSLKFFRGGNTADVFLTAGTSNILIEKIN